MHRLGLIGSCVLLVSVLAADPAVGQEREREGFWGSVGGGVGFNITENSEGERLTGFSAFARAGWALTPNWLVGGDVIGWFGDDEGADLRRGFVGGTVLFYPSDTGGFYFKGGLGGAFADISQGAVTDGTTWGFGWTLGLGYDIRLSRTLFLTLGADWVFQSLSTSTRGIDTSNNNQLGMLTAAITFF